MTPPSIDDFLLLLDPSVGDAIFEQWQREMPNVQDWNRDSIRRQAVTTAFHEAGHAAVHAFFGEDFSHFEGLTIVPSEIGLGRITRRRILPLDFYPKPFRKFHGKIKIMFNLAGRAAQSIIDPEIQDLESSLQDIEYLYISDYETSDEWKSLDLARQIENKTWPAMRILLMLEKWTQELVEEKELSVVIEQLASRLLQAGSVDFESYSNIAGQIIFAWMRSSKWKKRLSLKTAQGGE